MSNHAHSNLAALKRSIPGIVLGVALLGMGGALSLRAQGPPTPAQRHVVESRDFEFTPAQLMVAPGDTIVWINRDVVPHTATGRDGEWDSGILQDAESWHFVVQDTGLHSYYCRFHPAMEGSYSVK